MKYQALSIKRMHSPVAQPHVPGPETFAWYGLGRPEHVCIQTPPYYITQQELPSCRGLIKGSPSRCQYLSDVSKRAGGGHRA